MANHIIIAKTDSHPTTAFACEELGRYLSRMDQSMDFEIGDFSTCTIPESENMLLVGRNPQLDPLAPAVKNPELDDAIFIRVKGSSGIITGCNPRSVLIAAYRYLRELGAAFVRPGKDGEVIPEISLRNSEVQVCEAASNRYRAVCIEGADSYEHIADMVDWIPKAGMNGYYTQFFNPYEFFERWYSKKSDVPFTFEESKRLYEKLCGEICLRSLMHHAVGHGWTAKAFGIEVNGWAKITPDQYDPSIRQYLAEVGGVRAFRFDMPLNTQLCFSNPTVQKRLADCVVEYAKKHPDVSHICFTLADGRNAHCECEQCSTKTPCEWYVDILNRIDREMTANHLPQKITFTTYLDTLWPPKTARLHNPDRFLIKLAPITRNLHHSFDEIDRSKTYEYPEYSLNHIETTGDAGVIMQMLHDWMETCGEIDAADFDYHLWRGQLTDFGFTTISKTLYRDIRALPDFRLNGLISCQLNRCSMPSNLPMETMAQTLWNSKLSFEEIENAYMRNAFGNGADLVRDYLHCVSEYVAADPYDIMRWEARVSPTFGKTLAGKMTWSHDEMMRRIQHGKQIVEAFKATTAEYIEKNSIPAQKLSWEYLAIHAEITLLYANVLLALYDDCADNTVLETAKKCLCDYLCANEDQFHPALDVWGYLLHMDRPLYKKA